MVKNLLAMPETQIQPLGQEDPLEKGMATHSSILAWRIPWMVEFHRQRSLVGYSSWSRKELDTATRLTHTEWIRYSFISDLITFYQPIYLKFSKDPTFPAMGFLTLDQVDGCRSLSSWISSCPLHPSILKAIYNQINKFLNCTPQELG